MVCAHRTGGSRGPGSSPVCGHFVVFLGKTLYSHSAFLNPIIKYGVTCGEIASHPGGVAVIVVSSCYRDRDTLRS